MAYSVEIAPAAKRQIGKLDRPVQGRIVRRLEALGKDPRPPGVEKLDLKVGHRKEVYRGP